jgi:hypothetical protein
MKYFEPTSIRSISIAKGSLSRSIGHQGIFTRFIQALHISRRRQARYFIRRHRHLIAPDFGARPMVIDFESRKPEESSVNANGNQTPVVANDRALADA